MPFLKREVPFCWKWRGDGEIFLLVIVFDDNLPRMQAKCVSNLRLFGFDATIFDVVDNGVADFFAMHS